MANSTMAYQGETDSVDRRQAGKANRGGSQPPDPKGFHWRFRDVGKVSPVLTWNELRALANAGVVTDQHLLILVESNMTMPVGAFPSLVAGHGAVAVVPAPHSGKMVCRACEKELELQEFRESTSHPGSYTAACNACVDRHRQDRDKAVEMLPMSLRQMSLMQTAVTTTPRRGLRGLMDAGDMATWETRAEGVGASQAGEEAIGYEESNQPAADAGQDEADDVATMMMVPAEPTTLEAVDIKRPRKSAVHPLFLHAPQAEAAKPAKRGWLLPMVCTLAGAAVAVVVMVLMKKH